MHFETLSDVFAHYPHLEAAFTGQFVMQQCYEMSLLYDQTLHVAIQYDQVSIEPVGFILVNPLSVNDKGEIESALFKIKYKFHRLNNQKIVSTTILNALVGIQDNQYVLFNALVPGDSAADLTLLRDILPLMNNEAISIIIQNFKIDQNLISLHLFDTHAEQPIPGIGWRETWEFLETNLNQLVIVNVIFKFTHDGGVDFEIYT